MTTARPVDLDDIAHRAELALGAPVHGLRPLPGGLSSITLVAQVGHGGDRIVLKIAPPGLPPVQNRDVLRQARVLAALASVDGVTVPEVRFTDDGTPPLFGMAFVEGESLEPVNSDDPLPAPSDLGGRARGAAAMLAALHTADPAAIGLEDEPAGDLVAEVDRWATALGTVDADLRPGHEQCADALRASMPTTVAATVLHGDWRLGNMLCAGDEVRAVIDWEIWSVGDPRVDLAWFLVNSVHDGNPFATRPAPGMPDQPELLATYEQARGRPVDDLAWFEALVAFKQTATMGLILKRNRRQPVPDPVIEAHAPVLPRLLAHVHDRLAAS